MMNNTLGFGGGDSVPNDAPLGVGGGEATR
jgi:hypothetical protein